MSTPVSFDFSRCGGVQTVRSGGDPHDPQDVVWNFGVHTDTVAADSGPSLYELAPNVQGRWDGKTTVNHHNAVRKVLGKDIPAQYQSAGTCFPAGTAVLMADGTEKPIEQVEIGDIVVTHKGTSRRVSRVMSHDYTGEMYSVRVTGLSQPVVMTKEHPVFTIANAQVSYNKGFRPGVGLWTEAKDVVVGDRVFVPFGPDLDEEHVYDMANHVDRIAERPGTTGAGPQITEEYVRAYYGKHRIPRRIELDEKLARFFGLYIAEGSSDGQKVVLTFGGDEQVLASEAIGLAEDLFGADAHAVYPKPSVIRVVFNSVVVSKFLQAECGDSAYKKRVPRAVFSASREVRLAVLRGWMDGDGDLKVKGGKRQLRGVTASVELARGMRRLALSCRLHASTMRRKQAVHQRVASNDVYITGPDTVSLYPESGAKLSDGRGRMSYRMENGFACPVKSIAVSQVENLPVYNLEVEGEHTYVADSIAVHNCGGRAGSRTTELLQAVLIASGKRAKFKYVSHAWLYYLARREYGMLGRGDGVPTASIEAVLGKYGALTREEAGDLIPAGAGNDNVAVSWGAGRLSSAKAREFEQLAVDNIVTFTPRVRSAQELADGIAAGGIGICSDNQGYSMTRDSEGFCRPQGSWAHYHCRSGIHVTSRGRKGFAYNQSWGQNTPGGPLLEGCPDNCFGVDWDVQDQLCRSGAVYVAFGFQLWDLEKGVDLSWVF